MLSESRSKRRFIICFKKKIGLDIKLQPPKIVVGNNESDAISKACSKFDITNMKINRSDNAEGYIYCNNIYNPEDNN